MMDFATLLDPEDGRDLIQLLTALVDSSSAAMKPPEGTGTEPEEPIDNSLKEYESDKKLGRYDHILGRHPMDEPPPRKP